jgi:tetratricopeptide (TPR) repeat protein
MIRSFMIAILAITVVAAGAQSPSDRQRARVQNKLGWDYMKAEQFENAVKAFGSAVETDPAFDMPWYGLGRAHLALKQYVSAISALERCRDLYLQQVGRQFTNQQEAQRYRNDRIVELDEMIRQVQLGPQTMQTQDQLRQLQEQKRQIQELVSRGNGNVSIEASVPAWVSLSLGSAYFRSGKLTEAERAYKATVDADRRSGEALNNLAVVYLETERFALALSTIEAAKKTGFKVNPELEKAIRERAK